MSALYEYFAIIGYNPASGLKQEKIHDFVERCSYVPKSPLEATYEPKVVAHFPCERKGKPFANEIASLALPMGVRLYTEQNVPRDPSFHSFVVVREDGTRLHGCSLIFFEELKSMELRKQIFDAQMTYLRDFASSSASVFNSTEFSPDPDLENSRKFTTHSLPRKLSSNRRGVPISLMKSTLKKEESQVYYRNPNTPLFITRCMAVITSIPVIYSTENLLHYLWMLINDKFVEQSQPTWESILFWILHQIPLPSPGISLRMAHSHYQLLVRRPATGDLPLFDYPIETLFNYLPVDKFLKILTSFMLEKQILIISKNARTLMLVAECISALVFPFTWQMPYCPILPHSQFKFLEAPIPWLMGICLESDRISEEFSQFNICLFDVDSCRLETSEDLPSFPRSLQIVSQISTLLKGTDVKSETEEIHDFYLKGLQFNAAIRAIFLEHFASLFSTYQNYLLLNSEDTERRGRSGRRRAHIIRESSANFDKISFLVDQPESVLPFLSAFLETQMFTSFIDSKILSHQNSSETDAVFIFDQKIASFKQNLPSSAPQDPTELHISPPLPLNSDPNPPKYNGVLPVLDPTSLDLCAENELESKKEFENWKVVQKNPESGNCHKQKLIMSTENALIDEEQSNKETNAHMNMAHQNWKFVEQLLKETKAKTKRILVAKMGKEAVHLGHGQLHMGISGVEENTLVASFCDLLERIWAHGIKKKQGKSALWAYIIAYHEWEKKNNKAASRRSSSVSVDNSSPEPASNENVGDSPKVLVELISSIRRIADSMDFPRSRDTSPHTDPGANVPNNWSQSLLRAASAICDKITTIPSNNEEEPSDNKEQHANKKSSTGLPPRPPRADSTKQWRLFTPQLRKRNNIVSPQPRATNQQNKIAKEVEEGGHEKRGGAYRRFIYQDPLRAVNNQQQMNERRSKDTSLKAPRSASSQPKGYSTDLASRLSEDSLSKLALSTVGTAPRRRTRDLSSGPLQCQLPPQPNQHQQNRNRSLSRSNSPSRLYERLTRGMRSGQEFRTLNPLPNTMAYDLKNIIRMTEIKTDIGFARAFVRLALERKLLYQYLKKLLSNTHVLQKMYKRYAFLRGDDEREQFLFHLLSLNAVDFSCFTNSFLTIKMRYQVMFVGSLDRFPASVVYIVLTGSQGCTSQIFLPANNTQFTFDFKNLGILSTLRVATKEQSNQKIAKWYLDYILVRNCITAQLFYFRCGRWFGRGIDDGALERLLVAEAIVPNQTEEDDEGEVGSFDPLKRPESPLSSASAFLSPRKAKYEVANSSASSVSVRGYSKSRRRSPSSDRKMSNECEYRGGRSTDGITTLDQLQSLEHRTGVAINALMKHFLVAGERDHQSAVAKLSTLLCADDGLLPCINEIFTHGLIQRFFQKTYPWDYVEKVFVWFGHFFRSGESKKFTPEQRSLVIYSYKMVEKIGGHNVVGKEGKFHLFVLLAIRDHILSGLLLLMTWTPVTSQLYDQSAFLRQPSKLSYLAKLVGSLNEFQFEYEKSLTHGLSF